MRPTTPSWGLGSWNTMDRSQYSAANQVCQEVESVPPYTDGWVERNT